MALTSTGTEAELLPEHWNKIFIDEYRHDNVFYDLGMKQRHPEKTGVTAHWLAMADLTADGSALTEGTDPTEITLSAGDQTATLATYGGSVLVTDLLKETGVEGTIENIIERLAFHAKRKMSRVIRDGILSASTSSLLGGTAVARNSIATDGSFDFSVTDVRKAKNFFSKANVDGHTADEYIAVAHPDVVYDIQGDSNWTNAQIYTPQVEKVYKGEVGKLYGVRFVENSEALLLDASGSASTDVYQTYFFGHQGFGISELHDAKVIIKDPHPASDLDLYGSYGWKAKFAAKQLSASALLRYETGGSLGD